MTTDFPTKYILSVEEMRHVDAASIHAGTDGYTLMQRAGAAVAAEIMRHFAPQPVLVLCGAGNNGGDGFIVARLLAEEGWDVEVALLGAKDSLKGDASLAANAWTGPIQPLATDAVRGQLVVDALFGTGLTRDVDGAVADVFAAVESYNAPVVAVDIPSGVDGNSGAVRGCALKANITITFQAPKRGHMLQPGRRLCGDIYVADIGIEMPQNHKVWENDPALWLHSIPWPTESSHKYARGHVMIQGGPLAQTGAARLAALAALRVAGVVTVLCDEVALPIYAANLQAVMTKPIPNEGAFKDVFQGKHRRVFLIGPGAGVSEQTKTRILHALDTGIPCVLDADALTVFADNRTALFTGCKKTPAILTPHAGEFEQLFDDILGDKLTRAQQAAAKSGAVVVFKGSDTVIAHPDGRAVINTASSPNLATAGTGDVLAGLCAGLLAGGMDAFDAACAGVWIHGMAGREFGPGLTADDVPQMVPAILEYLHFQK